MTVQFTSQDKADLAASEIQNPLKLDTERYAPYLEGLGLTDAQKQELLQTLWDMMVMFADLEFGLDATGLSCGQNAKS